MGQVMGNCNTHFEKVYATKPPVATNWKLATSVLCTNYSVHVCMQENTYKIKCIHPISLMMYLYEYTESITFSTPKISVASII